MKKLTIETRIEDDKVATAIATSGYRNDNISDQFELLGLVENIKGIIQERIKKLGEANFDR